MKNTIHNFHLPRYDELPATGIYLEQAVKYINGILAPLGTAEMTSSMISNYVKKGYVKSPVKKQYDKEQIGYLIFIAIVKNVLSMDNIYRLFEMQKQTYDTRIAYDYFCTELENMLCSVFEEKNRMDIDEKTANVQKRMLRSTIIAVAHIIYLDCCFTALKEEK